MVRAGSEDAVAEDGDFVTDGSGTFVKWWGR